jgi:hypothetical protein
MGGWKELPFVDEWDEEANGSLSDFHGPMSSKVQWKCRKDSRHHWKAQIAARKSNGSGCPVCVNQKIIPGINDVMTTHPHVGSLLDEKASGFSAREISSGNSKKNGYWKCPEHPKFPAYTTANQFINSGCPVCSGRQIIPGFNDLKTRKPELFEEWHLEKNKGLDPSMLAAGTGKKIWWKCKTNPAHEWQATGDSRVSRGSGCPYCLGQRVHEGSNDLLSRDPDLAKYWNTEKNQKPASEVFYGSPSKKYWWNCLNNQNHSFQSSISVLRKSRTCSVCTNKQFLTGVNDLATVNPDLAYEWHPTRNLPLLSSQILSTSDKKVWWQCSKDPRHEWLAAVRPRHTRKIGCPICGNDWVLEGVNDLATTRPDLLRTWHYERNKGLSPTMITKRSTKKVWWRCEQFPNHVWKTSVYSRDDGKGCLYCTGQIVESGVNDLETKFPEIASEWNYQRNGKIEPKNVFARSGQVYWWRCSNKFDHEWRSSVSNRTRPSGGGCPFCSNKTLLTGFNDLATVRPDLMALWDHQKNPKQPSEILSGTHQRAWWKCNENPEHVWNSPVVSVMGGTGCPACAKTGFDQTKAGILYFIKHRSLLAKKVGITNYERDRSRVQAFVAEGWEVISIFGPLPGRQILDLETNLLRWLRLDLGLPPFLDSSQTKSTAGWSETFSAEAVSDVEVLAKIQEMLKKL